MLQTLQPFPDQCLVRRTARKGKRSFANCSWARMIADGIAGSAHAASTALDPWRGAKARKHGVQDRRQRPMVQLQRLITLAEDHDDPVTAGLITGRSAFHEKAAWKLRATAQGPSGKWLGKRATRPWRFPSFRLVRHAASVSVEEKNIA